MAHNDLMFTEIDIQIATNRITFVGAFTLPDVQPMINQWFDALNPDTTAIEARLADLIAKAQAHGVSLDANITKIDNAVDAGSPST
jgi:hypothetical protein